MPQCAGFTQFNNLYSAVMQCGGKEMNAVVCMIVPVFLVTCSNPMANERISCTTALLLAKNLVYLHLMAQYWYYTEPMIEYVQNFCRSLIVTMMFAVYCIAVNLQRMFQNPWNSTVLSRLRRNLRANQLGTILRWPRSVITMIKIKLKSGQEFTRRCRYVWFQLYEVVSPEPLLRPYLPSCQPLLHKLWKSRKRENGS